MEMTAYDDDGQLLTGSFMDYALPRADDAPDIAVVDHPVPATTNVLGVKGCGEAGCAGVAHVGDERGRRRALRIRHPPHRHAGDALPGLERDPGGAGGAHGLRCTFRPARDDAGHELRFALGENRLVAGVCLAHLVSHYYMMLLAPLFVFIRADYGVSYTELGLALTAFNVVSAVLQTPVGFLVDRIGARINLIGGLLLGAGRGRGRGARRLVLGVHRDVRACSASPTPSTIRPTMRCCPSTLRPRA